MHADNLFVLKNTFQIVSVGGVVEPQPDIELADQMYYPSYARYGIMSYTFDSILGGGWERVEQN